MLSPGQKVRVKLDWPHLRGPAHIRTPHYLRGETGIVVRHLGDYPNPEDLAFHRPAADVPLYHVAFDLSSLWHEGGGRDELLVEIYQHWLEPA
jgi:hypothetical protein